jgi:hypothetical protein
MMRKRKRRKGVRRGNAKEGRGSGRGRRRWW